MKRRTICVRVDLGEGEQREGEAVVGTGETHVTQQWRDYEVLLILGVHAVSIQ